MLKVTATAMEKIREYLVANNLSGPVRVAAMGGCGGSSLGLALDAAKEGDTVVERDGVQVIMDRNLLEECGRTVVDFRQASGTGSGFVVSSERSLPGGGGCGGSCASGCGC